MTPERLQQIEEVFHAACERAPTERAAFVSAACGADDSLRREVELLLAADEQAVNLIEVPAYQRAAPLLAGEHDETLVGRSIAHYRIVSLLGKGGMGEVYRALDTSLDRPVALKILPAEVATDAERMRRFVREAKAASALNHPHVATIYEIGEADGVSFIAMEYVAGQTLAAKINGHPLTINEIVEIGSQIADALDEAHGKGITHRDIKPANVMLNERGQVKVLDFGLAKIARPAQPITSDISTLAKTAPGVVLGTVPYMSPEQALGREVDQRSDLFSLGIVFYEMATGRLPFAGASTSEILDRILHSQPEAIARFNYDVPSELERIVRKCLEKERERRYQSARELLVDLKNLKRDSDSKAVIAEQEMLADQRLQRDLSSGGAAAIQPVASAPTNAVRPPARWRKWAVIAAVPVVMLVGLLLWQWRRPPEPPKVTNYLTITTDGIVFNGPIPFERMPLVTDGPRLYYSAMANGQIVLNQVSATGGEAVILPTPFQNAVLLDISPSRSELLVGNSTAGSEVWILPIPGGSPRRLGEVQAHAATWSPNGQQIVYANGKELYLADSNGTGSRKLLSAEDGPNWLRWAPDGTRLRFTVPIGRTTSALWEVNADGANLHPLLPGWNKPAAECCGNWTADGKYFIFQATRNQMVSLWALRGNADREPVQLTFGPLNFRAPVPSLDGRRLFAVGERRRGELVRYDKRTEQWVSYLFGTAAGMSAHMLNFSRDGEWMTYVTYPDGSLWRSRVDGTERLQLSFPPMQVHMPRWSPDGKKIAFMATLSGKPWQIYLVSVEGGAPQQLMPEERNEGDPDWSPDGATLAFFIGPPSPTSTINLLDLRTHQVSPVPGSTGLFSPRWSPDGRYIAAMAASAQKLMLFDLTTQQWTELTSMTVSYPQWSRDSKYIYFVNQLRNDPPLIRLRISDRQIERSCSKAGFILVSPKMQSIANTGFRKTTCWIHHQPSEQLRLNGGPA